MVTLDERRLEMLARQLAQTQDNIVRGQIAMNAAISRLADILTEDGPDSIGPVPIIGEGDGNILTGRVEPAVYFSWPLESVNGAPFAHFFPANVRGITFDLVGRRASTYGGFATAPDTESDLPDTRTMKNIRTMVIVCDTDAIAYVQDANWGTYIPAGRPISLDVEGQSRVYIRESFSDVNQSPQPLSVAFGVMAWFSNKKGWTLPWNKVGTFQRVNVSGGTVTISKTEAADTADNWTVVRLAPPYKITPTDSTTSFSLTKGNEYSTAFASGFITSHLGRKQIAVLTDDNPLEVRIQGILLKGDDTGGVIVNAPATPGDSGLRLEAGDRAFFTIDEHFGWMRILVRIPAEIAAAQSTDLSIEVKGEIL